MKILQLLILLVAAEIFFSFAVNELVVTDDVYYYFLIDHFSEDRSQEIVESRGDNIWLSYSLMPIFCGLKVFLIAICLFAGIFFMDNKTSFSSIFSVAVTGQFIFLIPSLLKLVWFGFVQTDYSLSDVYAFPPVSMLSVFGSEGMEPWQSYPLSVINLFEVLYFIALAYSLSNVTGQNFAQSLSTVFKTYGLALLLWITFVVFIIVSFS